MPALSAELLNQPGLFPSRQLRAAAVELEDFLLRYREVQTVLGVINEGILEAHVRMLTQTADIVAQRGN